MQESDLSLAAVRAADVACVHPPVENAPQAMRTYPVKPKVLVHLKSP